MEIFKTKDSVIASLAISRNKSQKIGFVPTMGALHLGHQSLVERCRVENDIVVASIFVNPTQFDNMNDLANYPRCLDNDLLMLERAGCNFVFAPSVEEMYPEEDKRAFDFGMLDKVMEGAHRPGHFNGVAQIVTKLFDVVQPDRAYFGEKDFQQLVIIKRLVEMMNYPVLIVGCPIVREKDGLAMSSRNALLSPEQRKQSPVIARSLFACKEKINEIEKRGLMHSFQHYKNWVIEQINECSELQTEYFNIVRRNTLQTAVQYINNNLQACIAVRAGAVRLIDNCEL